MDKPTEEMDKAFDFIGRLAVVVFAIAVGLVVFVLMALAGFLF